MKTMPAGKFKAHCLKVMDQVRAHREPVIITKKGVPVAKLVPTGEPRSDLFGCMAGTAEILGDIEAPVVPSRIWKATK
ncbi:MAG: type II toxin-antitoxin system Phd/YefM family antitoxin [Candidatus Binatia bacterium]